MSNKWYDKPLAGDGHEYELLQLGVENIRCEGVSLEIGLRRGGGTKLIMENLKTERKIHVAIDPYGNLPYANYENRDIARKNYSNEMRNESLSDLYLLSEKLKVNFIFFNLSDTDFFNRFSEGIPIYDEERTLINNYCFVHFDGPHTTDVVMNEFNFINDRTTKGSVLVFDDISHYDHDHIEDHIINNNWKLIKKKKHKAVYTK